MAGGGVGRGLTTCSRVKSCSFGVLCCAHMGSKHTILISFSTIFFKKLKAEKKGESESKRKENSQQIIYDRT